jgi:hypothetical protein
MPDVRQASADVPVLPPSDHRPDWNEAVRLRGKRLLLLSALRLQLGARASTWIREKKEMSDSFRALVDKAVEVLQRHAPPDGLSDHDALTELYGIFDGPEYRSACEARSAIACIYGEPCAHPEKCKLYGECYRKLSANPSHVAPLGWKLVPMTPTDAMNQAGYAVMRQTSTAEELRGKMAECAIYEAMVKAAPPANVAPRDGTPLLYNVHCMWQSRGPDAEWEAQWRELLAAIDQHLVRVGYPQGRDLNGKV